MNHLKGMGAVHVLKAQRAGGTDSSMAISFCHAQSWHDSQAVAEHIKGAITAMEVGALPYTDVGADFSAAVRPLTVIGRLQGVRRVPMLTRVISGLTGITAGFVGAGKPIPVNAADLSGSALTPTKVAGIAVVTDELVMSSSPQAEVVMRDDMVNAAAQGVDLAFLDPSNTGSADSPASVTSGVVALTSSGTAIANIDADLQRMLNQLIAAGSTLTQAAWILLPSTAVYLAGLRDTSGARAYPGVSVLGGELLGLPVLVAGNLPAPGSPPSANIVLLDASQVVMADEDQAIFDISRSAALQMLSNPTNSAATGTATTMVSLYQVNCWALRSVKYVNWELRRPFVSVLTGVAY